MSSFEWHGPHEDDIQPQGTPPPKGYNLWEISWSRRHGSMRAKLEDGRAWFITKTTGKGSLVHTDSDIGRIYLVFKCTLKPDGSMQIWRPSPEKLEEVMNARIPLGGGEQGDGAGV